jgi:ABC-type branched-subunit amino acid transport system substrate-binding protein
VANGDIPTEGVMCAQWLQAQGHDRVGLFWEAGSSGKDYADYFRDTALQLGLTVAREVKLEPNPVGLQDDLAQMRELGVEGLYYGGYGYATFHFAKALKAIDWDPPRVMGTAFMFYSNSNAWAEGLEGWHGVDQLGEDGANPNYNAMIQRFEQRFGRKTANVVVALAYDTARAGMHGIANAAIPAPKYVKDGLEKIRWMPATNGGPGCYVQFGPWDHKGYKGDFLTIRELRGGELRFDGYHRPEWPSNAATSGS